MEILNSLQVELLLKLIIDVYFTNSYCINFISENIITSDMTIPVVSINSNLDENTMEIHLLNSWNTGCSDFVMQTNNATLIINILENIVQKGDQRRGDRKIIILRNFTDRNDSLDFNEKSLKRIPNVLLVTKVANEFCEIYNLTTHKYTGVAHTTDSIFLDEWSSCTGFKYNRSLFPLDMSNLYGKVVKVAAFDYRPYVILNINKTFTPEGYDGTEMRIAIELCRWLNCTLKVVVDAKHEWGTIFDNRTGNGVLGALVMDKADIGITALYTWYHEYKYLDLSMPAIRTGITCLVPSPMFQPGWKLITMPFSKFTWMAIGGTLIVLSVALWIASKLFICEAVFITFRLMITQCPNNNDGRILRHLIIWYILAGMLLDTSYSGNLASSLTVPRYGFSIDTVKDLGSSGIEWGATHDAWIFSIMSSDDPTIVNLVNKFKILPEKELETKTKDGNFGVSIERLPAGHYALGDYIKEKALPQLQLMQEDIYWEQCVMMARKSSPYTKKYNQLLSRLHSSGLLLQWETQVATKYLNMKIQIAVKQSHKKHRHSETAGLDIKKVLGAFIVLGIGYSISTCVWILELISRK